MKKVYAALVAATLVVPASAAIAAPTMHHTVVHKQVTMHRFSKGQRFDRNHADHYAQLDYHHYRHLKAPPRGYVWVRSGRDALLVRSNTNIIAQVVANLFG